MTISISNLQYATADNTVILMTVTGWQNYPPIQFGYHPDDTAPLTLEVKAILDAGGQTIAAYVAPAPVVPASVTRAQGKIQLSRAGLLSQVQALVNASDAETQIWFADSAIWERNNAHVLALAAALSPPLTSDQIDVLFTSASAIV